MRRGDGYYGLFVDDECRVRNWNSKIYTNAADLANKLKALESKSIDLEYEVVMIDDKNQGVKVYWDSTEIARRIEINENNIIDLKATEEL